MKLQNRFKAPLIKQKGFLLFAAVILVAVVGALIAAGAYMLSTNLQSGVDQLQSGQALYIAEAGLVRGRRAFNDPDLTQRLTCSALSGAVALTNISFGQGVFSVTGTQSSAATTLSSALNNTADTMLITSSSGFANSGQVQVDGEVIDYDGISSGLVACGQESATCLVGLKRGMADTFANSHSSGARVSQYQCTLQAEAGISDLTNPKAKRDITQDEDAVEAWAVGNRSGNNFRVIRWNQPGDENAWTDESVSSSFRENLYGVSMVSKNMGWAVGRNRSNQLIMARWNGENWVRLIPPTIPTVQGTDFNKDLFAVQAVSNLEAWAVGQRSDQISGNARRYKILRWTAASNTWCALEPTAVGGACGNIDLPSDSNQARNLLGISLIDTDNDGYANFGFAVGQTRILEYDSSAGTDEWQQWPTNTVSQNLYDVKTVSTQQAWAVGNSGFIYLYNGSTWSLANSNTTNERLNGVAMLDTDGDGLGDDGWAVGGNGTAIHIVRSGGSYTYTLVSTPNGRNLEAVKMLSVDDVWAVGNNGNIIHWDGSSWSVVTSPVSTRWRDIDFTRKPSNDRSMWREPVV